MSPIADENRGPRQPLERQRSGDFDCLRRGRFQHPDGPSCLSPVCLVFTWTFIAAKNRLRWLNPHGIVRAMLLDDLKKRMMAAMKAGNVTEKEILRTALGEITGSFKTTDEEIIAILKKLVKSNRDTMSLSTDDAQKQTLAEEIAVLQTFLPKTLDVDAILAALEPVKAAIKDAKADGQAMGVASKHLKSVGAVVESENVKAAVTAIRAS